MHPPLSLVYQIENPYVHVLKIRQLCPGFEKFILVRGRSMEQVRTDKMNRATRKKGIARP